MAKRRMTMLVVSVTLLAGVSCLFAFPGDGDKAQRIPVEIPEPKKPPKVKSFMKVKETGAHRILSGLVNRDFATIKKEAHALKWVSLDSPKGHSTDEVENKIYQHFRLDFARLAGKLEKMAEQKNLEGAAYVYQNLTSTCISCHNHLRDTERRRAGK